MMTAYHRYSRQRAPRPADSSPAPYCAGRWRLSRPSKEAYRSGLAGPKMSAAAASVPSRVCRPLLSSLMACRKAAKCSLLSRARALRPRAVRVRARVGLSSLMACLAPCWSAAKCSLLCAARALCPARSGLGIIYHPGPCARPCGQWRPATVMQPAQRAAAHPGPAALPQHANSPACEPVRSGATTLVVRRQLQGRRSAQQQSAPVSGQEGASAIHICSRSTELRS